MPQFIIVDEIRINVAHIVAYGPCPYDEVKGCPKYQSFIDLPPSDGPGETGRVWVKPTVTELDRLISRSDNAFQPFTSGYAPGTKADVLNTIHCMLQELRNWQPDVDFDFDRAFELIESVRDNSGS